MNNNNNNDDVNNVYVLKIINRVFCKIFIIKAINEDTAFEIFWNRYKDFPEADIDEEFGSMVFDDSYYDECCRLHRELYTRTDKTHMIASKEADIIIDGVINVDISDDIVYITEVGM